MPPKKSPTSVALGETIRSLREKLGFTQEAFAVKVEIDRSYYGAIERGEFNLTMDTLIKIANGLNTPAWEILKRAGL